MARVIPILSLFLGLSACIPEEYPAWDNLYNPVHDSDNDGFTENEGDCNDNDPAIHPDAQEYCNYTDDNCNEVIDEDAVDATAWFFDGDGDGFGLDTTEAFACEPPSDLFVTTGADCNDTDANVNPQAPEVCDGDTDEDCDGLVDRDDDDLAGDATWYRDADSDFFGNPEESVRMCEQPTGYVLNDGDCDDSTARANPIHDEECDGIDNDCDGNVDNESVDEAFWYRDVDGDGHGDESDVVQACEGPSGYVPAPFNGTYDCDDSDAAVFPAAVEVCNAVDDDCDGLIDDGVTSTFFEDVDLDGYGNFHATLQACTLPAGFSVDHSDCDDGNAAAYPGATEVCDGVDNSCDGFVDQNAVDAVTFYADADSDGFGDVTRALVRCEAPSGYVLDHTDCDDGFHMVNPAGIEDCTTGFDDDCDGSNNDPDAMGCTNHYLDADQDGYGIANMLCLCTDWDAYTATVDTDCDDGQVHINPGALETCDSSEDEDCDGEADEHGALNCEYYYADWDGDGFGVFDDRVCACEGAGAYTAPSDMYGDCDDSTALVNPWEPEVCWDGVDNDCSGDIDGADAIDALPWYPDVDGDGFGEATAAITYACDQPGGFVADNTDCEDTKSGVYPGHSETCSTTFDDNCDGDANDLDAAGCRMYYQDADSDGYGVAAVSGCHCTGEGTFTSLVIGDCDDADFDVSPSNLESCNGIDDDCDGDIDEADATDCTTYFLDEDGDTYGVNDTVCTCAATGYYTATQLGDCNDQAPSINTGAGNCGLHGEVSAGAATAVSGSLSGGGIGNNTAYSATLDYDGDGHSDLLVGSSNYDSAYVDIGGAFLFLGPITGTIDLSSPGDPDLFFSPAAGAAFKAGHSLSHGDFDGDGWTELLVGTDYNSNGQPVTMWMLDDGLEGVGIVDDSTSGVTAFPGFYTAHSVGDVNADGADDALFEGDPHDRLFFGSATGFVDSGWSYSVAYNTTHSNLDFGDLTGDGDTEFFAHSGGQLQIVGSATTGMPPTVGTIFDGDHSHSAVAFLHDVTGDGYGDLAFTVKDYDGYDVHLGPLSSAGLVAILPGSATVTYQDTIENTGTKIVGSLAGVGLGFDVDASDVDGDTVYDLLYTSNGTRYLHYGPISPGSYTENHAGAWFTCCGYRMENAGDNNGDGYGDFILGDADNLHLFLGMEN